MDRPFVQRMQCAYLLLMALGAIGRYWESVFAVMACPTGFTLLHLFHGYTMLVTAIGVELGVAVFTRQHGSMHIMAEVANDGAALVLIGFIRWLETNVTFVAVARCGKSCFAVVTTTTRFTLFHFLHGHTTLGSAVWIFLGMAVTALVHLGMEVMAENSIIDRL